jgi:lysine 2,3-aminomutase
VWLVVQVNHPRELSAAVSGSISAVVAAGVPVVTQTVLLRGVNDSVSVLTELFSALVALSVKPYYLFQGDLAPGTSHFRVSLRRGLRIVGELRKHVSGLAMPVYAVDLPRAGGKVPLSESAIKGEENGFLTFESLEGTFHTYPLEHEESAL